MAAAKSSVSLSQSHLPGQKTYPPKLHASSYDSDFYSNWYSNFFRKRHDSELVHEALQGGLDPNTVWTKQELVEPGPTGGCVMPDPSPEPDAWKHCNTPLHLAVLGTDYDAAETILSYGGDIDIYNEAGKTPLHEAVFYHSLDRIRFLAQHGADMNRPSRDGLVPLQMALRDGAEELFFSLLELGASSQAAGHSEWSIADLALLSSERVILARLIINHTVLPTPMSRQSEASQRPQPEELGIAAGQLLAVASSSQLFPAEHLYEAYESLLYHLDFHQGPDWTSQAVGDLVESFNAALYSASDTPGLALNEKFCPSCLEFQSSVERSYNNIEDRVYKSTGAFEIHRNRTELEVCAEAGCPLCSRVGDELYKKPDGTRKWRGIGDESPVTLQVETGLQRLTEHPRSTWLTARLADSKSTCISFNLKGVDTRFGSPADDSSREDTTGSKQALGIARRWLETCQDSPTHSQCREAYRATTHGLCSPLPTRVLHVGTPHRDPFLFESNGARASYCTLSYCWGRTGNTVTTKSNISERIKGIPLDSLPLLIREAILSARSLRFEYIWIDALCIIQDDDQDWAQEVSVMNEVYSRAAVTISSLIADDSINSLFQPRSDKACRTIPLNLWLPKRDRPSFKEDTVFQLSVHPHERWMRQTHGSIPIHQRAWILQEHLMSTRILYFGEDILHWECLHGYLLEPCPSTEGNYPDFYWSPGRHQQNKLVIRGLSQPDQTRSNDQDPLKVWQTQVEEFTKRKMTKTSDRIPAFLGISTAIGALLNDEFVGGIWRGDNLLDSLCWNLTQPNTTDPRGPTWTWASRSGEVHYAYLNHSAKKTRKASVISCDVSVSDPSQSHVFGSITLKGTLRIIGHKGEAHRRSESFDQSAGSLERCYAFDMLEFEKGPSYTGFGYPVWPGGEPAGTVHLLLRPVNDDEDFWTASVFQRIGIVSNVDSVRRGVKSHPSKYFTNCLSPFHMLHMCLSQTRSVTGPRDLSQTVEDIQNDRVVTII